MNTDTLPEPGTIWRHKERGTKYEVLYRAALQCEIEVLDDAECVVYKGANGKIWVRPLCDFMDGRFEICPPYVLSIYNHPQNDAGKRWKDFPLQAMEFQAMAEEVNEICKREIGDDSVYSIAAMGGAPYGVNRWFHDKSKGSAAAGIVSISLEEVC